ncbi:MAG: hypothetical protein ACYCV6_02640 [Steroidobacteraceae bacterium]
MVPYSKIKSILEHTEGGRALLEPHRRLVRKALNETVSNDGADVIEWLHESITRGTYRKEFFRNIEHLTRDAKGLLFWKEHLIGRFSLVDDERDEQMAQRLAAICRQLESKGFPLTSRALLSREIQLAPADTPWKQALYTYATFLMKGDRVRAVFWAANNREMLALEKQADGSVRSWKLPEAAGKTLPDMMSADGFEFAYVGDYRMFEDLISKSNLTPADIARALA